MDQLKLIRGDDYILNDKIKIRHPTLKEIYEFGEINYWRIFQLLTVRPYDYMVQLDDMGIDYETVTNFQLFTQNCKGLTPTQTSIFLGDLDLTKYQLARNNENDEVVLLNEKDDSIIDELICSQINEFLRSINFISNKMDKAGNKRTKRFLIEEERRKQATANVKNKKFESFLSDGILALANSKECSYDYNSIWDMKIYQFNASKTVISKNKNIDSLMMGIYTGNIDSSKINKEELNWLGKISSG